jgi:hypothetical protein
LPGATGKALPIRLPDVAVLAVSRESSLMWNYLSSLYNQLMNYANRLSPQEWVIVLVITLVLGVLCLRGFGSRSNY